MAKSTRKMYDNMFASHNSLKTLIISIGRECFGVFGGLKTALLHIALSKLEIASMLCLGITASSSNVTVDSSRALKDINELKQFMCAFPPQNIHKRPRIEKFELGTTSS